MLKHMITSQCHRTCSYCLTKNLRSMKQSLDFDGLERLYRTLRSEGEEEIMLTGGEPTMSPYFWMITGMAWAIFKKIHLTTQNTEALWRMGYEHFDSITYSLHTDGPIDDHELIYNDTLLYAEQPIPIYASIIAKDYKPSLPYVLKAKGYSGLTINEDHRGGGREFLEEVPDLPGFSVKINRRGTCIKGTKIILPDLTVTDSFEAYL